MRFAYFICLIILLILAGCQSANVCIDDGYCSSREIASGNICSDCVTGPFLPNTLTNLNYFSQVDLENLYGTDVANSVARSYTDTEETLFSFYAEDLSSILETHASKTLVMVIEHNSDAEARQTIERLVSQNYVHFDWSLTTQDGLVYYTALTQSKYLDEAISIFLAGTSTYLVFSENNDLHDELLLTYLEQYGSEVTEQVELTQSTSGSKLMVPKGVTVVATDVDSTDVTIPEGVDAFQILNIEPSEEITDIVYEFELPQSWVDERTTDPSDIGILLSDDGVNWEIISSTYVSDENDMYQYTSIIPHFSLLLVTLVNSKQCDESTIFKGGIACNDEFWYGEKVFVDQLIWKHVFGNDCNAIYGYKEDDFRTSNCYAVCPEGETIVDGKCTHIAPCLAEDSWERCETKRFAKRFPTKDSSTYMSLATDAGEAFYTYYPGGLEFCPETVSTVASGPHSFRSYESGDIIDGVNIAEACHVYCPEDMEASFAQDGSIECNPADESASTTPIDDGSCDQYSGDNPEYYCCMGDELFCDDGYSYYDDYDNEYYDCLLDGTC